MFCTCGHLPLKRQSACSTARKGRLRLAQPCSSTSQCVAVARSHAGESPPPPPIIDSSRWAPFRSSLSPSPPQDKLCGLELEGVSSFLRNFRDGGDYSPPPSPPPPTQDSNVSWYNRGGKGWGGGGVSPAAGGGKGAGRGDRAVTRKSSSIRLLRACADVKLTRSTLNGLQQDFAVQVCAFATRRYFCLLHMP